MSSKEESKTIDALEKIAKELELANRLKIFELIMIKSNVLVQHFDKFNDPVTEFEEKIRSIEEH